MNVWAKRFKLPQLTHKSFLTIDHSDICTWHIVLHTRGWWKFSLADIKKIFCRSHLWPKSSCVLVVAAWNVFPIHSLFWETNGLDHSHDPDKCNWKRFKFFTNDFFVILNLKERLKSLYSYHIWIIWTMDEKAILYWVCFEWNKK